MFPALQVKKVHYMEGRHNSSVFLKGMPHVCEGLSLVLQWAVNGVWQLPCLHEAGWLSSDKQQTGWLLQGVFQSSLSSQQFWNSLADFPLRTIHLSGSEIGCRVSHIARPHWWNLVSSQSSGGALTLRCCPALPVLVVGTPISARVWGTPRGREAGGCGKQTLGWVWGLLP